MNERPTPRPPNRTTGSAPCRRVADETAWPTDERSGLTNDGAGDLSSNIAAFCSVLRNEHGFVIGQAEAHDSLRALESIGIANESRVRSALRLVCCGTYDQTLVFDRAFDLFFRQPPRGTAQPAYAPRHTRPGREKPAPHGARSSPAPPRPKVDAGPDGDGGTAVERRADAAEPDDATAWQMLRARYGPDAGTAQPPRLRAEHFEGMLTAVSGVIASLRLGRLRRWQTMPRGTRFDLRQTMRASLQTGGDPIDLRYLGHPRRNPRFVVLIDGSRSMSEQTGAIVHFARALCERSARANVFFFSTEIRDVTRELRAASIAGGRLDGLGQAWGGGTKIGASLDAFIVRYGATYLTRDTLVIIFSDGLDAGDLPQLERAMRNIDRRSAGIVWLNPHAASPGYVPTARGMRTALPFITLLTAANNAREFTALARHLAQNPRIRGRRR